MSEQSIGINVWLRDTVAPALEKMQRNFAETATKAQASFNAFSTRKFNNEIEQASRKIKDLQGDIALLQKFKNVEIDVRVKDAELKAAQARLRLLTSRPYRITVTIRENWSTWERNFRRSAVAVNQQLEKLQSNTSLFGRILLLAGVSLTPLISGFMALAGAATALAGSLTLAAAALGGAFVAALAQALPAVGLLAAAFARVGAVFKAVQATEKAATGSANDHTAALDRQRNAARNLIRAQEGLSDAHKNLAEARRQAKRDLEDLASAERRVRIEQENARLAMVGARRSARSALGSGSFLEFEQAQVEMESAALAREDSARQGNRAIEDAERTRAQGVAGNEGVIQSQRALRDATWALADAHREVARAQQEQGAAASAAADANKDLTESERDLRDALLELRKVWKDVGRGLTDPIIDSFTFMVKRITALIQDPEILAAAKNLSRSIGESLRTLFAAATTPRQLDNLRFFMRQAAQNIPQIARGMANLLTALANLGRAASPILARMVSGFVSWSEGIKAATENQQALNEKVAGLAPHLGAWGDLLRAVWDLFKELVIVSNEAGLSLTNSITNKLGEWTQWLRDNREQAKQFFTSASETAKVLASAVIALVAVLGKSTSFDWLQRLATFFEEVLVPALDNAIKIFSVFSGALTELLSLPVVRDIVQWSATFAILGKAAQGLALAIGFLAGPIGTLITVVKILGIGLKALWLTAFGPYVLVIGGIVVALVLLEKKFGIVTKAINFLRGAAENAINWLKENWQSVLLVVLTGPFGAIILAFRRWGDDILTFFKELGGNIGSAIGNGLRDALNSVISTINGVFAAIVDNWPDIPGVPSPPRFQIPLIGGGNNNDAPAQGGTGGGSFARGGVVPGSGSGDTVPAMLTPGEVVLNKRQQQMIGVGRIYNVLGATGGRIGGNRFSSGGVVAAEAFARAQLGEPYGRPDEGQSRTGPNSWDCSGYAGAVARAAGADIPLGGTTWTYFDRSSPARGNEPIVFGFWPYTSGYNGGYDEHMGVRVNGTWYESTGSAGVRQTSRGDSWWKVLRVPNGLQGLSSPIPGASGGASGSSTVTTTSAPRAERYETRQEFFQRITGFAPSRRNRFLVPYIATAYQTGRRKIGDRTGGTQHLFATGGEVPGREGEPRSIVAHAGEMILNRGQQMALGGPAFLRRLFKPRADTGHFAAGGEVTSRLNITPREAGADLAGVFSAINKLRIGRNVRTVNNLVSTLNVLFEFVEERLQVYTDNLEKARTRIANQSRTRTFGFSGGRAVQFADEATQVQNSLADVETERGLVQTQITQTGRAVNVAQRNLRQAQAFARRNPRSPVAERRLQQAEKAFNLFSGQLQDLTGQRADLAQRDIELRRSAATLALSGGERALGTIDARISRAGALGQSTAGLIGERLGQMQANRTGLSQAMSDALGRGDTDFAEELRKQIEDLDTAIVETQQSKIGAAIDDVNKQRSSSDRKLDLGERIAKFFGRDISGLIDQRINSIRDQIGGLTAALGQAEASGNTSLADEIRDQIASLNQDINDQYRRKFTEAREAANKQFSFQSSLNDVALSIAQISGPGFTPNLSAIRQALTNRGALLNNRAADLQQQLAGAYATGDQDLIMDLTVAIEENRLAVLQNSQALAEATGALTDQTWTSSAWDQFRVAVFDGLGGLMPNMTVPALATGGYIQREGLFKLHAGEAVIPAEQVGESWGGDTNITINTPSPVVDPRMIAEQIGFEYRLRRRK